MRFYTSLNDIPRDEVGAQGSSGTAVTIGKFDGMHLGHTAMISLVRTLAAERSLTSTALTFDRHPFALLRPELCPLPLVSNDQKRELLAEAGVDQTVMLEFTREFSQQTPADFVRRVLVDALAAKLVVVGEDYRFGAGAAGTVADLEQLGREHGFEVVVMPTVTAGASGRVSSSRVRELLAEGLVREAGDLLGRPPSVRGTVVRGALRGRELGFPTANLSPEHEGFIPADGVYAGWLVVSDGTTDGTKSGERMPAAISVGNNPTFEGVPARQVEAHVLDRDLDLYGLTVEVLFFDRVRGMKRFDSLDELVAAITADVVRVRELLATATI